MATERVPAAGFPPAVYLRDECRARRWPVSSLPRRAGVPKPWIEAVLLGYPMTPETAAGPERAFGVSAQYWLKLDRAWWEHVARRDGLPPPYGAA